MSLYGAMCWVGGWDYLEWLLSFGDMTFGFDALADLVQTIYNRYFRKLLFIFAMLDVFSWNGNKLELFLKL